MERGGAAAARAPGAAARAQEEEERGGNMWEYEGGGGCCSAMDGTAARPRTGGTGRRGEAGTVGRSTQEQGGRARRRRRCAVDLGARPGGAATAARPRTGGRGARPRTGDPGGRRRGRGRATWARGRAGTAARPRTGGRGAVRLRDLGARPGGDGDTSPGGGWLCTRRLGREGREREGRETLAGYHVGLIGQS
jgi:hypothetical protein